MALNTDFGTAYTDLLDNSNNLLAHYSSCVLRDILQLLYILTIAVHGENVTNVSQCLTTIRHGICNADKNQPHFFMQILSHKVLPEWSKTCLQLEYLTEHEVHYNHFPFHQNEIV